MFVSWSLTIRHNSVFSKDLEVSYRILKAHKQPLLSLQSVPIRRTNYMSLVTSHIKICYNNNFRHNSCTCLSTMLNSKCLSSLYVAVCFIHFLLTLSLELNKHKFLDFYIMVFFFRLTIIKNKIKMPTIWHRNPLIKLNIISFKLKAYWNLCLHNYAITLVLVRNYTFRISILYICRFL